MPSHARLGLGTAVALVLSMLLLVPATALTAGAAAADGPSAPYAVEGYFTASPYPETMALDEARHRLYTAGLDQMTAYDTEAKTVLWRKPVGGSDGVAVDPVSGIVYVSYAGGSVVQVVNPDTGAILQNIKVGCIPRQIGLDTRKHVLYAATDNESDPYGFCGGLGVSVVPQSANEETLKVAVHSYSTLAMAVDSEHHLLYVARGHTVVGDGYAFLAVISTDSNSVVKELDVGTYVQGIAIDEERAKVWLSGPGGIVVVDQGTHTVENTIDAGSSMWGIGINPAQGLVFAADQGGQCPGTACGKVAVIDAATQTVLTSVPLGARTPHGIAVDTAADKVYASDTYNGQVVVLGVPPLYGPGTIGFSARSYTIDAGATATVTVERRGDLSSPSTVAYATSDGTATAGEDYTTSTGTVTFPVGATSATFTVPTTEHGDPQDMPSLTLTLGAVTNGSLRDPHTAVLRLRESVPPVLTATTPPDTAQTGASYSYTFAATGRPAPVFSVTRGALPPGLVLSPGGLLSGTPTASGPFTFRVTADNGTDPASSVPVTLHVKQAPTFTASTPPGTGTAGAYYFYSYQAAGDPAPSFSLAEGRAPCGVDLFPNGAFGGVPTTPGTYQFRVRASNGASPDAVTPLTTVTIAPGTSTYQPGAPTITGVSAGDGSATVAFSPPVCDGGAAVDSYTVTASPGGATASGGASPLTVTGLANGTSYTFRVTAHNSAGTSAPSAASSSVTPGAVAATALSTGAAVTVVSGQPATVTSRLTSGGAGLAGRSVALVGRSSPTAPWTLVSTLSTGPTGAVSFAVRPSRNTQYRFEFAGGSGYQPSVSSPQSVSVAPAVSLALKPAKVAAGKKSTAYGVATPAAAGTVVTLQELRKGTWTNVGTARIAVQKLPDGTTRLGYAMKVKLKKGKHQLRAVTAPASANVAGTSPTAVLKVTKA